MSVIESRDIRSEFTQAMSCAACTVNVVTTDGPAGRAGVTVSAMSSVSADGETPTLLVCVHHKSSAADAILQNGAFCVNVLRDDQSYISDTFAGRLKTEDGDKFSCAEWVPMTTGAPRVTAPLAAFDCTVRSGERVGTHHIFIGEVRDIHIAPSGNPLIFANRAYGSPVRIMPGRPDATAAPDPSAPTMRLGSLHTIGPYLLPKLLRDLENSSGPIGLELHEGDQRKLTELLKSGAIDVALLYDLDLDEGFDVIPLTELRPYVLLHEQDPLRQESEVSLSQLLDHRMVLLDAPPSRDYFLSLFDGIGEPTIGYRAQSFEMVRGMVAHGLGYSLLATKPASSMSYDGKALVVRPLKEDVKGSRLALATSGKAPSSYLTMRFIQDCRSVFRDRAA
ncbi:flavin reductase [Methyloligella sp. 2.7D]|uniref:flavin reductase n=1 Tax=unclassified Methyloligella TaxID=2625955 RepID=UPI00157CB6CE|nr:flavin reductase [Methyloligella sp. GL2]QKP76679.1 flavin reductase [Methyloligella sp. GL2]